MCHEVALIISSECVCVLVCVCAEVRLDHGKVEYLTGLERSHGRSVWDHRFKPGSSKLSHVATSASCWGLVEVCVCLCVCVGVFQRLLH